jgi:hypothetical protein
MGLRENLQKTTWLLPKFQKRVFPADVPFNQFWASSCGLDVLLHTGWEVANTHIIWIKKK